MKILLLLAAIPFFSSGTIIPNITTPERFSEQNFNQLALKRGYYLANTASCGVVSLKLFYPSGYKEYIQSGPWVCLFSVDVIHDGYGPGRLLPEKVYYDKKSGLWKKKKHRLSKDSTRQALKIYGISSLSALRPLVVYNIRTATTHGYAVVNSNISLSEKQEGVKKKLAFCLIQNHGYSAFCNSGSIIREVNGKEIDFTPYMLKSLETVEIGSEK